MSQKIKEKTKWAKGIDRDGAYSIGFHIGARRTLEFLAEEGMIESSIIAWLLEERYFKEIENGSK